MFIFPGYGDRNVVFIRNHSFRCSFSLCYGRYHLHIILFEFVLLILRSYLMEYVLEVSSTLEVASTFILNTTLVYYFKYFEPCSLQSVKYFFAFYKNDINIVLLLYTHMGFKVPSKILKPSTVKMKSIPSFVMHTYCFQ